MLTQPISGKKMTYTTTLMSIILAKVTMCNVRNVFVFLLIGCILFGLVINFHDYSNLFP